MSGSEKASTSPLISTIFTTCLVLYRDLYLYLADEGHKIATEIDLSRVSDEYGRLNVWGSESGALRIGRGSLDDRLRDDQKLRSIILDILNDLVGALEHCMLKLEYRLEKPTKQNIAKSCRETSASGGDNDNAQSDDSSISSGNSSSDDDYVSLRNPLNQVLSSVYEQIRSLYKVSALLRRPVVRDKYIRSLSKDGAISCFLQWDEAHLKNKFPYANELLVHRLALANTRRRQQLRYWENHQSQDKEISLNLPMSQDKALALNLGPTSPAPSGIQEDGQTKATSTHSFSQPSKITKQSFSTVAQSALADHETFSGRARTVYEPSMQGYDRVLRVPDHPKVPFGVTSFECPYCRSKLNVQAMKQRQLWKQHVFRDLRPYLCTFDRCLNAEKMYVTRHDWLYHEAQLHQKVWTCIKSCEMTFESPNDLKSHMLDSHRGSFSPDQLPILSDMCERPIDPGKLRGCALCGAEMSLRDLNTHVASHLEEIALFVLPVETDESAADMNSRHAERPHRNDERLDDDDLSSLGSFNEEEVVESFPLDANTFNQGLEMEEEAPLAQIEGWFKTDDASTTMDVTKSAINKALPSIDLSLSDQEPILPTTDSEQNSGSLEQNHVTERISPLSSDVISSWGPGDFVNLPDWRNLPKDWDGLPSGWEKRKNPENRLFYFELMTETATWEKPPVKSSEICRETVKRINTNLEFISDTMKLCLDQVSSEGKNVENTLIKLFNILKRLESILTEKLDTQVNIHYLRTMMIPVVGRINYIRETVRSLRLEVMKLRENDRKKTGLIRRIFERRDPTKNIRESTALLERSNSIIQNELDLWERTLNARLTETPTKATNPWIAPADPTDGFGTEESARDFERLFGQP